MKVQFPLVLLIIFIFTHTNLISQPAEKMQWFKDAKLGIFIHWGIYAVDGIDESWSFYNEYISYEDYMKQLNGFTASNYQPEVWASLIKESGAGYAVITAKHHDGVALWDSKYSDLNVVDQTPAGRDLILPLVNQLKEKEIKTGIYYSLLDWSHPDYPNFTKNTKRYTQDSLRWQEFTEFNFSQISEIQQRYEPDILWFDGDWEQSADQWKSPEIRKMLLGHNPNIILNSRLQGYGDYATPEQGLPIHPPKDPYWELCMTMNDSWGYQPNDQNYKSPYEIIRIFSEVISMGGNLLLDIGPKADGNIPQEQINILTEMGNWTSKHAQAIFSTKSGIPKRYFDGPTTLSKDEKILYLFISGKPNGPVMLRGLNNKINRIWVVGNGTKLDHHIHMKAYWSQVPGIVFIDLPHAVCDEYMTVLAVLLDDTINLYQNQ